MDKSRLMNKSTTDVLERIGISLEPLGRRAIESTYTVTLLRYRRIDLGYHFCQMIILGITYSRYK